MRTKIINLILLFIVWGNVVFSQKTYTKSIIIDDKTITYNCSSEGNIYNSDFVIYNGGVNLYYSNYSIDVSESHYKLKQDKKILSIAAENNSETDIIKISKQIDLLITQIFDEKDFDPNMIQSVFFHRAILKAKERFIKDGATDLIVHPGYFLNKTYFFDQRDYFIKTNVIKEAINTNSDLFKDQGSQTLLSYVNSISEAEISFEKFYSFYVDIKNFKVVIDNIINEVSPEGESESEKKKRDCAWWCPLGCGSDWGCCGNYSGCCFYTAPICFVHDAGCSLSKCEPRWLCFPGCQLD